MEISDKELNEKKYFKVNKMIIQSANRNSSLNLNESIQKKIMSSIKIFNEAFKESKFSITVNMYA